MGYRPQSRKESGTTEHSTEAAAAYVCVCVYTETYVLERLSNIPRDIKLIPGRLSILRNSVCICRYSFLYMFKHKHVNTEMSSNIHVHFTVFQYSTYSLHINFFKGWNHLPCICTCKNTKCQCMTFLIKTRVRFTPAVHKLRRFCPIP